MTQSSTWCERLQARLMAALDAAWATIEGSNDPDLIRKACDKARICGDMAAQARKVAAMVPAPKPARMSQALAGQLAGAVRGAGGGRGGREPSGPEAGPPQRRPAGPLVSL
jgi:hypothetical protein